MSATNQSDYTLHMKKMFQRTLSEFKTYYCREDFELALKDFDCAPKDAKNFRLRDLARLCRAREIEVNKLIMDRTMLKQIPTRSQMQEEVLQSFYYMYLNSPSTINFMERIVRRLAPEYSLDTVRVAILKKFIVGAGDDFKRFNVKQIIEWAKNRLNESEKAVYDTLPENKKREIIFSKIDDSIFEQESVELTDMDILLLIVNRIEKYKADTTLEFEEIELCVETKALISKFITQYNLSEKDTVSMQLYSITDAIKNGIIPKEDRNLSDLITCVENEFREQLKMIKRISKTGKDGTAADLYKQAKKDAVKAKKVSAKKNNLDFELLDMCNDLALGNFRVNGKTKVYLYYFAFMFGMTISMDGKQCDQEKDIVKNLFHDFYNDNLLRILSGDYADSKTASAVEKEPTGEGINYKNFVEAIYVYFLWHDELEMMPGEKIDKAESLIEECVKRAKKMDDSNKVKVAVHTAVYKEKHINILLNKKVEELVDYILANYFVIAPNNVSRIMVASEENTAFNLIEEIMEDLDVQYTDNSLFDIRNKNNLTKEMKDDMVFQLEVGFDWKVRTLLEERYCNDEKFMKIVSAIDDRTHINKRRYNKSERVRMLMLLHVLAFHSSEKDMLSMFRIQHRMEEKRIISIGSQLNNALSGLIDLGFDIQRRENTYYLGNREYEDKILNDLLKCVSGRYYMVDDSSELLLTEALVRRLRHDKRITRSELISIHFNYYIGLLNETDGLDTFPDVFEDYASTINPILEEARYQPLNEKNIFDMYIVTALYFYLVENNGYM